MAAAAPPRLSEQELARLARDSRELIAAAQRGDADAVRRQLTSGVHPDTADPFGETALRWGTSNVYQCLPGACDLRVYFDGFLCDDPLPCGFRRVSDRTLLVLFTAATNDHDNVARALLLGGARPDQADRAGWTPVMWAASYGADAVLRQLLEYGASPIGTSHAGYAFSTICSQDFLEFQGFLGILP